ncbi:hypothetical protein [Pseudoxanthomonas putridarboris]|uniref:Uncharacterized protein n=1 Tax=Pseudoxanthomonas putridarboris TaxID=752605 RepID=A0ABU9J4A6_9GAMM
MSLPHVVEESEESAPENGRILAAPHPLDDSPSSLDRLLHLLQGTTANSLADPGITVLSPSQLDQLTLSARRQAEHCQDGILLVLDLLQGMLDNGAMPDAATMRRLVRQLHDQFHDQQRWHSLADNAAYYRDHTQVAERIAACFRAPHG